MGWQVISADTTLISCSLQGSPLHTRQGGVQHAAAVGQQRTLKRGPCGLSCVELGHLQLYTAQASALWRQHHEWCAQSTAELLWHRRRHCLTAHAAEPSRIACEQCYMGTKVLPMTQLPEFAPQGLLRRLTISVELQVRAFRSWPTPGLLHVSAFASSGA